MILKHCELEHDREKAVCVTVQYSYQDAENVTRYESIPIWLPKSQIKPSGNSYDVPPWLLEKKEKDIANETGRAPIGILVEGGDDNDHG